MKSLYSKPLKFVANFWIYLSTVSSIFIWYGYLIKDPYNSLHALMSVLVWLLSLMLGLTISVIASSFSELLEQKYKE